jgi:hypothetical protein
MIVGAAQTAGRSGTRDGTQYCPVVVMPIPVSYPCVQNHIADKYIESRCLERYLAFRWWLRVSEGLLNILKGVAGVQLSDPVLVPGSLAFLQQHLPWLQLRCIRA